MQKIMSQKEAYFYNFYGICIGTYLKCQTDTDHKRKNKDLLSTHNRKSLSPLSTVSSRKTSFTYLCFKKKHIIIIHAAPEGQIRGGRIHQNKKRYSEHGSRGTRAGRRP